MQWFRRQKTFTKLLIGFGLMALLLGIVGWQGIRGLQVVSVHAHDLHNSHALPMIRLRWANVQLVEKARITRTLILESQFSHGKERTQNIEMWAKKHKEYAEKFTSAFRKCKDAFGAEEGHNFEAMEQSIQDLDAKEIAMIDLATKGEPEKAYKLLEEARKSAAEVDERFAKVSREQYEAMGKAKTDTDDAVANTYMIICIVGAAGFVLVFAIGFWISRIISRPLLSLAQELQRVGIGSETDAATAEQQSGDEVEHVIEATRRMVRRLQRMVGHPANGQAFRDSVTDIDFLSTLAQEIDQRKRAEGKMRQAKEAAEKATAARDFFLAQVSHDLRTPLNHVLGFCQLLETTPLNVDQLQDVKKIHQAGNNLKVLIDDILDYQKIVLDQIRLNIEEVDLAQLIAETAQPMEFKARERGNRLQVDCAPDLGHIHADRNRLRQILNNLLVNAVKFTSQGVIAVTARRELGPDGDWVAVSVADTGKGINPENLDKLFTPFGQFADRRDNPDGTGLGLAICKSLCEKMSGGIGARSELGKGSTFTFRLPASPLAGNAALSLPIAPLLPMPVGPRRACTVLVIDDDPQIGELMKRFLEKEGFIIEVALTGVQGLEKVKSLRPDVVTVDILMPGIDGWGVLAALKNDADTADIPVVILSIVDDRSRGFLLGAHEYVTKPVDWERLTALMARHQASVEGPILVVDDDADWREVCRRSLENRNWQILEADNGETALRLVAEKRPRLVLLDLMMPVMDGFEFLEHVRRRPELHSQPIIVVTAKELKESERQLLNGRVHDVVKKGCQSLDDLLACIAERVKRVARPCSTERN